jgi:hypothetical protein
MKTSWNDLLKLTQGEEFEVERVRMANSGIALEGNFKVPAVACLNAEDIEFLTAFVSNHGSIKAMEKEFDISYPTVKNRLNHLVKQINRSMDTHRSSQKPGRREVLQSLLDGKMNLDEAISLLD